MYHVRDTSNGNSTRMALGDIDFMRGEGSGQNICMAFLNRHELIGRGDRGRLDNSQGCED
ncbi:hypothetical protein BGZ91_008015, partial [Linnemannia elongata]